MATTTQPQPKATNMWANNKAADLIQVYETIEIVARHRMYSEVNALISDGHCLDVALAIILKTHAPMIAKQQADVRDSR